MDKIIQRPFMNSVIRQRTENSHLCLTDLIKTYEEVRVENNWVEKRIGDFFVNKQEIEYIIQLLDLQGVFINTGIPVFTEQAKNQGVIKALKNIGEYQTKGRGDNKSIYCNPYIFIAVAQWLNPRFRALVTIWVTDSLILNRIEAGKEYSQLCSAISEHIIPNISETAKKFIYSNFAKLINIKVFGSHKEELRQIASKEQLQEMNKVQTKLSALIEVGYISNYQEAKTYLEL